MKTSNKILIALFTLVLFAIVGTNLVLKAEYEKIDLEDPFYGYSLEKTSTFKDIKLKGNGYGLVQIQSGDSFQLRVKENLKAQISYNLRNDTLELSLMPEGPLHQFDKGDPFIFPAEVFIIVPKISSVHSQNAKTRLTNLDSDKLILNQQGPGGWVFLHNNSFDSLSVDVREGGMFKVGTNNQVKHLNLKLSANSSFEAEKDIYGTMEIKADSLASLKLPASLLREAAQQKLNIQ